MWDMGFLPFFPCFVQTMFIFILIFYVFSFRDEFINEKLLHHQVAFKILPKEVICLFFDFRSLFTFKYWGCGRRVNFSVKKWDFGNEDRVSHPPDFLIRLHFTSFHQLYNSNTFNTLRKIIFSSNCTENKKKSKEEHSTVARCSKQHLRGKDCCYMMFEVINIYTICMIASHSIENTEITCDKRLKNIDASQLTTHVL